MLLKKITLHIVPIYALYFLVYALYFMCLCLLYYICTYIYHTWKDDYFGKDTIICRMQGVIEGHILIVLLDYIIPVKSQFFLKQKNLYTVLILSVVDL